jgi:hypothetical protein
LTSTQRYQSVHERNQERLKREAQRAAGRRAREKRINQNPNASVVMSETNRSDIKGILRELAMGKDVDVLTRSPEETFSMLEELVNMGFGSDQAALALQMRGDVVGALNWLLVNIPEEDLPSTFDPRKTNAISVGVLSRGGIATSGSGSGGSESSSSSSSSSSSGLAETQQYQEEEDVPADTFERELHENGFSVVDIRSSVVLVSGEGSSKDLRGTLLKLYSAAAEVEDPEEEELEDDDDDDDIYGEEPLDDEVMVLESMYPDATIVGPNERKSSEGGGGGMEITVDLGESCGVSIGEEGVPVTVEMWLPPGSNYPRRCVSTVPTCVVLVRHPSLSPFSRERVGREIATLVSRTRCRPGGGYVVSDVVQHLQDRLHEIVEESAKYQRDQRFLRVAASPAANSTSNSTSDDVNKRVKGKDETTAENSANLVDTSKKQPCRRSNRRRHGGGHVTVLKRPEERRSLSRDLQQFHRNKSAREKNDVSFRDVQNVRRTLPSAKESEVIVQSVLNNRVLLISGETGCGKTTQVPQFLLNHAMETGRGGEINIICTQPRRIAAIGVAERVAEEQGVKLGDVVGYQIRLDSKMSKRTRLLFCTTGILLRRMQHDMNMEGVTHIVVDEVRRNF